MQFYFKILYFDLYFEHIKPYFKSYTYRIKLKYLRTSGVSNNEYN